MTEEDRRVSDNLILGQIAALPSYKEARLIFAYVGVGWEVDTLPLIRQALAEGKAVAVPRWLADATAAAADSTQRRGMDVCLIRNVDDLRQDGETGFWEPLATAPLVSTSDIDFIMIPCVACDEEGRRLGRGGGYYDRFLASASSVKAALCRADVLQELIPVEAHDVPVDYVVTESRVIDCTY